MKSLSVLYSDEEKLAAYVERHKLTDYKDRLLVQAFSGTVDEQVIAPIREQLCRLLPEAVIVGMSSSGSIMNGRVYDEPTVLNFLGFDNGCVRSLMLPRGEDNDDFTLGKRLAQSLKSEHTKLFILFSDAMQVSKEQALQGFQEIAGDIPIGGGAAANIHYGLESWMYDRSGMQQTGLMAVAVDVPELRVDTGYALNWEPIGKVMQVTHSEGNVLYELDGQPAVDVYNRYLGPAVVAGLPASASPFPLIVFRNGVLVARVAVTLLPDKGIFFTGDIRIGDRVQFSFGHVDSILSKSRELVEELSEGGYDSLLVYSCVARKSFMQQAAQLETLPLQKIAPATGFFTYGEFYKEKDAPELMNCTMTYIALSDQPAKNGRGKHHVERAAVNQSETDSQHALLSTLTNLVKVYTEEIEEANGQLSSYVEELRALLDQVHDQKQEIERKNDSITDSIRYAHRIQTAVLPDSELVATLWPDASIWYQPRDIVSGDFYWMAQGEGCKMLAVVDCTGHGVPGAFMSVIGFQALNRIVLQEKINEPGRVIERLDQLVREVLRQDEGSGSQDGMDVCLITWREDSRELSFASANRPLYILQQGMELIELKGTRLPVGGTLYEDKSYETETLTLPPNTRIFLGSDGIADQQGGDTGRKFTPQRIREILEETRGQTIEHQTETLKHDFKGWQGRYAPLDDLCWVGVEL